MVFKDNLLNLMLVTTVNIANYGYNKIKGFIGSNIAFSQASIFRVLPLLGIGAGIPVYQNFKGFQMNEKLAINAGLRYIL